MQGITKAMHYEYDIAGRLWQVWRNSAEGGSASGGDTLISQYSYDANGNRVSRSFASRTDSGSYDAQDRMLTYGNASYVYTRNGELKGKIEGSDTTHYTYDYFGNLISVSMSNGNRIDYIIDGQNRRIGKKVNGVIVKRWIYSGQLTPVAELDSANNVISRFVGSYMIKNGNTFQLIRDHLGSVRLVVDAANGTIAQRLDYDEFGNVLLNTNPDFQPYGFAGGIYDPQTKLVRFGARDYDAITGRWTNKDPIFFAGGETSLYGYVGNDPINWVDPTGLAPGDPYPTREAAGTQAVRDINQTSIQEGIEYAGRVYQNYDGSYSYTAPNPGTEAGSDPGMVPWGVMNAGYYHTHGSDSHGVYFDEIFSDTDKDFADQEGQAGFLGTPQGCDTVQEYIPRGVPYAPRTGTVKKIK